jgi:hypothetical protein
MLLDQQVPMEWAFKGPATLKERLGHLDPARLAEPAVHRIPAAKLDEQDRSLKP